MTLAPALGPIGRIRTGLVTAVHSADRTTVHDCLGPVNAAVSREPIECREVDEIPHTRQLPVAQATPARHPRPAPEFLREHLPGNALRRTKIMPVRHARSETRGRPPRDRRDGVGKNGSTRSHNGSGSSGADMLLHGTATRRIRFRRFCYTLLQLAPSYATNEHPCRQFARTLRLQ